MSDSHAQQDRIGIFIPSFDNGGVERMLSHLARGFVHRGCQVDMLVDRVEAPYLPDLASRGVRLIVTRASSSAGLQRELTAYLVREQPTIVLSSKPANDAIVLACKRRVATTARFFIRVGTHFSGLTVGRRYNPIKRWLRRCKLCRHCGQADGVFAVSQGVADDVAALCPGIASKLQTLKNPTVTPELETLAAQSVDHPWFNDAQIPVIIGVGRLSKAKNFGLLIEAFARARQQRLMRLAIIGAGRQHRQLMAKAQQSGYAQDIALLGFQTNPYPFMQRAALFVLSSLWEGSPNALIEALALGRPVVATDCPSGPREILQNGKYGELVPLGDTAALAAAIVKTLANPPDQHFVRQAARPFTIEASAAAYLEAMGVGKSEPQG